MSYFPKILAMTLHHEGGWSDHPKDPGGATMNFASSENVPCCVDWAPPVRSIPVSTSAAKTGFFPS